MNENSNPMNPSPPSLLFDYSRLRSDFWNSPLQVRTWMQKNAMFDRNFSGKSEQQVLNEMARIGFNPNGGLDIDWCVAYSL